jgi:hypothetical protein
MSLRVGHGEQYEINLDKPPSEQRKRDLQYLADRDPQYRDYLNPAATPQPEEVLPYDDWTNDQLREELGNRELPRSGNHAELVQRLIENDNESED